MLFLFIDNDDVSLQFCNDTEYDYDNLGEVVYFISSNSSMSSNCNILVNLPTLKELVVVMKEEVAEPDEGCSISYQSMSDINTLYPKRSFCQQRSETNTYTNFIFVRALNGNNLEHLKMSLSNTQHVNFTLTGNIVEASLH